MLEKGREHEQELTVKKNHLYESIKAVHGESNDKLYAVAGVQLEDFEAFESFVLGIMQIYNQTVSEDSLKNYDFRSPALKLSFDFQRAVKLSHQKYKSAAGSVHVHDTTVNNDMHYDIEEESMKKVLMGMLMEVSEMADQLEDDMKQNQLLFSTEDGNVETVLKLDKDREENIGTLVDQDSNEYVMMKPSDTTIIIEDLQLIHDFILILVTSFVLGWMFTWIGLPGKKIIGMT